MAMVKPFWVIGDGRILNFQGEVIYMEKDSVVSTLKAKWNGAIEVMQADGKSYSVMIVESVVDDKITFNDLLADVAAPLEETEYTIKIDKGGNFLGVDNLEFVKENYLIDKEKEYRAENKKVSKEDKQLFMDSLSQSIVKNDVLKNSILAYGKNFFDIYGKLVPSNTDTIHKSTVVNTKRYFAQATKNVDADLTMYLSDIKGPKFTLNEVFEYSYAGMQDFLTDIKVKDPVFEANTSVKDQVTTIYDSKLGWPQKISEELVITNGKYKVIYKWAVKFAKEK